MLELRTHVGRGFGYTVGGKAYRILEDEMNQVFERRDVLMVENPAKVETPTGGPRAGPRLTAEADADSVDATEGEMDMLDAEGGRGEKYTEDETSTSDEDGSPLPLLKRARKRAMMATVTRHPGQVKHRWPVTASHLGPAARSASQLPMSHGRRRNPRRTW